MRLTPATSYGMSHISSSSLTDLDIWEFVSCSKCHLPFSSDPSAPPQVPFWLTECGHVICNLHLSMSPLYNRCSCKSTEYTSDADQSCCECGAQGIQMIPLQREVCFLHFAAVPISETDFRQLDPPMSNWFCSAPHALDTISYSIKARESIVH